MNNQILQSFATKLSNALPDAMFCHLNSHTISFEEFTASLVGTDSVSGFIVGTESNGVCQFVEIEVGGSAFSIEPADSMTGIKTLHATSDTEALILINDMLADLHTSSPH